MCPPLDRIATRFETSPAAMSGMPGMRTFPATAAEKSPYEISQRTTPIRSEVCQGMTLTGKATSWSAIAT